VRVLVTGASGQVGGEIARRLVESGHDVVGLGRKPAEDGSLPEERLLIDIGESGADEAIERGLGSADAVVHAAASLRMEELDPEVLRVNCVGTREVFSAARRCGASQFVFISSIAVIGEPGTIPIREDHPVEPRTTYHATKLFGEQLTRVESMAGLTGASLRISSPVGPSMNPSRILPVYVRRAAAGEELVVMGAGTRKQNYVDVRDVAGAVERALTERAEGIFNVAGGESVTNADLAARCVRLLGSGSPITRRGDDPLDGEEWVVSTERARRELGWEPEHSIDDSIGRIAGAVAT
jgi:UDP-glucose 4-epimerase